MKTLLLSCLFAAAALAQVPAHSVNGSLTVDVSEVSLPVPYGETETKAVVSVCSTEQVARFQVNVTVLEASGGGSSTFYDVPSIKSGGNYCASVVATAPRSAISFVDVQRSAHFAPPPTPQQAAAQRRK